MSRMHRMLFPASTTTNQTRDCSNFCDPACPYNCYSYPDHYFSPPPPPIFPPRNQVSSYLAIVASLFTVIFVLVGFYVLKVKCYSDWCGRRRNNGSFATQSDSLEDEFDHENQVDHPIWLITTIGLQQSVINSITVCRYKKGEGLIEGTECSVCLNEFREDETLRVLPKCNHAFHIPCIDTWLRSHISCPLCRAGVVPNNASSDAATLNGSRVEENSNTVVRNEDSQIERNGGEIIIVVSENRQGTGEAGESEEFTRESISKQCPNVDENEQTLDEIRNGTSSVSVDSSVDHINDDNERHTVNLLKKGGEYSALFKSARRSSIAQCLHVTPVSMKRSVSCSGRIVSTRGYRSLNSSLPR